MCCSRVKINDRVRGHFAHVTAALSAFSRGCANCIVRIKVRSDMCKVRLFMGQILDLPHTYQFNYDIVVKSVSTRVNYLTITIYNTCKSNYVPY